MPCLMKSAVCKSNTDMISQQGTVEIDSQPNRYSAARVLELAGWMAVASCFLLVILYVVPFYNRWYRVPVNLLGTVLFFVSIVAVALVLVPLYLFKRRFSRAMIIIALGLVLFFATLHTYN